MSKSGLFAHFGSKRDLRLATVALPGPLPGAVDQAGPRRPQARPGCARSPSALSAIAAYSGGLSGRHRHRVRRPAWPGPRRDRRRPGRLAQGAQPPGRDRRVADPIRYAFELYALVDGGELALSAHGRPSGLRLRPRRPRSARGRTARGEPRRYGLRVVRPSPARSSRSPALRPAGGRGRSRRRGSAWRARRCRRRRRPWSSRRPCPGRSGSRRGSAWSAIEIATRGSRVQVVRLHPALGGVEGDRGRRRGRSRPAETCGEPSEFSVATWAKCFAFEQVLCLVGDRSASCSPEVGSVRRQLPSTTPGCARTTCNSCCSPAPRGAGGVAGGERRRLRRASG